MESVEIKNEINGMKKKKTLKASFVASIIVLIIEILNIVSFAILFICLYLMADSGFLAFLGYEMLPYVFIVTNALIMVAAIVCAIVAIVGLKSKKDFKKLGIAGLIISILQVLVSALNIIIVILAKALKFYFLIDLFTNLLP